MCRTDKGTVYYANKAQITTANIIAGGAIVHLVSPLVAAPEHQDIIDALIGLSQPTPQPTQLWQDILAAQSAAASASAGPAAAAGQTATSSPAGVVEGSMASPISMPGPIMGPGGLEAGSVNAAESGTAWGTIQRTSFDSEAAEDDAVVNYSFESDFMHAEQAASGNAASTAGLDLAGLGSENGQQQGPAPEARSSAHAPRACLTASPGLLTVLAIPMLLTALL